MTAIYRATLLTPFGKFMIAVDSTKMDAKSDMYSAAESELRCHVGMIRVKDIAKSNRRILANMEPIKNAQVNDNYWAWIK